MSESNQGLLERTFSEDEITAADKMKPIVRNDDESKYTTTTTENDDTTTPNSSPSQSSTISSSLSIPSPVVVAMNEYSCDDEFTTPSHRAATAITTTTSTTTRTTTHFSICDDLYSPLSSPLSSPSIRTLLNSLKQRQDKGEEEDSLFVLNIDPFEESQQTPSRVLSRNSSNNESKRDRAESFYGIMNNNMNHMNVNNTRRRAFSFMMDPKTLQSNSEILKENLEGPLMMEESNINETNIKKGWMVTKESSSLSSPPQQRQHNYDGDDEKDDDEQFLMNTTSTHRSSSRMNNNNNNIQRTSIISFQDSPLTSTTSLPSCSNQNSNKLVNSSPQSQTTNPSKTNTTMDSYCTRSSVIDYYHDLINKLSRLDFGIIYSILSFYLFTIDDWFMYTQLLLNHHYYSSSNTPTINDPKSQNHEIKKHCSHIVMNMFYGKKYNHLFQVFPSIHWNVTNPEYLKYFTNDPGSSNNNTSNSSSVNHDTSSLYIQCISNSLKSVINHCSHFISNPHFNQISHLFEFKRLKSFHLQYGFHDDSNLTQLLNKSRKSLENMSITSMAFSSDDHHLHHHHHGSSKDHFHRRRSTSVMTSHSFNSLNSNTRYHPSMPSLHSYHPSIPPYPNVRTLTLYSKYLNQVDFDKLPSALNSLSIYLKYPVIEQNNSSLKNFIQHVVCCSATTTSSSSSSSSLLYTPHSTSNGIQDLHLHFNMSHYIQYFTNDNRLHSLSLTYCQIPSNFHWNIFSKLNDLTLNITHPLELNNLCSKIGHQLKRMYLIIDIEEFSNSESFDHFNASCPNLQELHLSDLNYIISKHLSQSQSIVRFGCDSAVNDLMCIDYLLNIKNLSRLDLKVMVNMYAFIDLVKNRSNHMIQQQHAQPQQQQPWNGASNASLKMIHLNIECLVPTNSSNHDNMNDIPSSMNTNPTSTLNHVETRSRSQSLFSSNHTTNTIRFGTTTTITTNNNTIRSITHNSSELSMSNNSNTSNSNNTAYSPPTNRLSNSTCSRNQFNSLKIHRLELIYRENETISDLGFLTYFRSIEELSIKYGTIYSPLFSQLLSLTNIKKLTLFKTNINHVFLSNKYKVLTFQNIVFIDCHLNSNFLKVLNEYQVVGGDSTMNSWAQHNSANKNGTSRSKSKTLHSSAPISSFNSVSSSNNSTPTPPPHKSSTLNSQESCMLNYIIDGYSLHVVGVPNIVVIQDDLHKLQSKSSNILDDTSTLSCNQSCCIQ